MRDIFEYRDNFADYRDIKSVKLWGNLDFCKNPDVSIIMPCYSHPDYFKQSLQSAINQDYKGTYEIIIADNNELTNTPTENQKIVEEFNDPRVIYYRNVKNIGMFGNWNRLAELARAPFVVYLHDDDMLLPSSLTTLTVLQKRYNADGVNGAHVTIDALGNVEESRKRHSNRKLLILKQKKGIHANLFDMFLGRSGGTGCGCLFRKDAFLKIGGFSPEFYPSADYALNANMAYRFKLISTFEKTFFYRVAENESLSVYEQFVDLDKHFRKCMSPHIKLPRFILNMLINTMYRVYKIKYSVLLGKKGKSELKKIKGKDKILLKTVLIPRHLIKDYRLL